MPSTRTRAPFIRRDYHNCPPKLQNTPLVLKRERVLTRRSQRAQKWSSTSEGNKLRKIEKIYEWGANWICSFSIFNHSIDWNPLNGSHLNWTSEVWLSLENAETLQKTFNFVFTILAFCLKFGLLMHLSYSLTSHTTTCWSQVVVTNFFNALKALQRSD